MVYVFNRDLHFLEVLSLLVGLTLLDVLHKRRAIEKDIDIPIGGEFDEQHDMSQTDEIPPESADETADSIDAKFHNMGNDGYGEDVRNIQQDLAYNSDNVVMMRVLKIGADVKRMKANSKLWNHENNRLIAEELAENDKVDWWDTTANSPYT